MSRPTTAREPYSWPTAREWLALTDDERRHTALRLLMQAVRQEERGQMPMSLSVKHAMRLGELAFWRDGVDPTKRAASSGEVTAQ